MSRAREWARDEREEVADGVDEWANRHIFCDCSMCWPIDEGPGPMVCGGAS